MRLIDADAIKYNCYGTAYKEDIDAMPTQNTTHVIKVQCDIDEERLREKVTEILGEEETK